MCNGTETLLKGLPCEVCGHCSALTFKVKGDKLFINDGLGKGGKDGTPV